MTDAATVTLGVGAKRWLQKIIERAEAGEPLKQSQVPPHFRPDLIDTGLAELRKTRPDAAGQMPRGHWHPTPRGIDVAAQLGASL